MSTKITLSIVGPINRGGFGRVEKVKLSDGTLGARKVFDPSPTLGLSEEEVEKVRLRFIREVKILRQLAKSSDYFIPIIADGLTDDPPWFIMPLADKTYREQIEEDRANGKITVDPLADILNGLDAMHRLDYKHRDMKPENVLLHDGKWKLADFGLALPPDGTTTQLTSTNSWAGTRPYMAPEQVTNFREATAAVDIYAFGCMLHDFVASAWTRVSHAKQSGPGLLGRVIEKCTELDPTKRFVSIGRLREVLLPLLANPLPVPATLEATAWITKIEDIATWDKPTLEQFIHFVENLKPIQRHSVLQPITEEIWAAIIAMDPAWEHLAIAYAEWVANAGHVYSFCDVLIKRLELLFTTMSGALSTKSAIALAAAKMGHGHNRYFVMERVLAICDHDLDPEVAKRIAMDIQIEDAKDDFLACAQGKGRSITSFHPEIAAVLT